MQRLCSNAIGSARPGEKKSIELHNTGRVTLLGPLPGTDRYPPLEPKDPDH
jgi:hypothetical protein